MFLSVFPYPSFLCCVFYYIFRIKAGYYYLNNSMTKSNSYIWKLLGTKFRFRAFKEIFLNTFSLSKCIYLNVCIEYNHVIILNFFMNKTIFISPHVCRHTVIKVVECFVNILLHKQYSFWFDSAFLLRTLVIFSVQYRVE